MTIYMAFGFLPGGVFVINNYHFDKSISHSIMMVPTTYAPRVYKRETSLLASITLLVLPPVTFDNTVIGRTRRTSSKGEKLSSKLLSLPRRLSCFSYEELQVWKTKDRLNESL
ncbi:hypothetical protein ACLOJK_026352 [Asimina triloba]